MYLVAAPHEVNSSPPRRNYCSFSPGLHKGIGEPVGEAIRAILEGTRGIETIRELVHHYRERDGGWPAKAVVSLPPARARDIAGDQDAALLCPEDVRKDALWCHRQILAAGWEEQSGQEITEL